MRRWQWFSNAPAAEQETFLSCFAVQESHKRRQRVLAHGLEATRVSLFGAIPTDQPLTCTHWEQIVLRWWSDHLRARTVARPGQLLAGTTALKYLTDILSILPMRLGRAFTSRFETAVASYAGLRPAPQARGQTAECMALLSAPRVRDNPRLWLALALCVQSGQRLCDAIGVASGWLQSPPVFARASVTFVPDTEKADKNRRQITRPMVLQLATSHDHHLMHDHLPFKPLSPVSADKLYNLARRTIHGAGIRDVRIPRRNIGAAVDAAHGEAAAKKILRHTETSKCTLRYVGVSAEATRLDAFLSPEPRRPLPLTRRPATSLQNPAVARVARERPAPPPPPTAPSSTSSLPDTEEVSSASTSVVSIDDTMATGRASPLALAARTRSNSIALENECAAVANRLLHR
jgi:hypothetical protein